MKISITIESITFWTAYILLFLFGGFLAFIGFPFRPFIAVMIAIPLLLFQKIEIDKIFFLYLLLFIEILISSLINNSGMSKPLLFSRYLLISYATYLIAYNYLRRSLKEKIFKICLIIGLIQFPIVAFQRVFYDQFMQFSQVDISYWDIGFGTFFVKNDSAMSIFLTGLILILLFDKTIIIKYKTLIIFILVATIFMAGSRILQLTVLIILAIYYLKEFSLKKIVYIFLVGLIGLALISQTKLFREMREQISKAYVQATFQESGNLEAFKSGKYSRNAAVMYYLDQPLKWFGDGPGEYYDVTSREHFLGNTGQIFTFYSEVGIIGLLISYLILFQMSRICSNKFIANLYFLAIFLLSITSNILSDASIILAYNIFLFMAINPKKPVDAKK